MDKILDRFGLYDFFGIWGPGALTLGYTLVTAPSLCRAVIDWLGFSPSGLDQSFLWLLLFSAGAYLVGLILHDITKILFDWLPGLKRNDIVAAQLKANKTITERLPSMGEVIVYVNQYLPDRMGRIEQYHANYGMSRSLWLAFTVHGFLLLFFEPINGGLVLIDLLLSVLEIATAEHYYRAWAKNVYILYDLCMKKNARN